MPSHLVFQPCDIIFFGLKRFLRELNYYETALVIEEYTLTCNNPYFLFTSLCKLILKFHVRLHHINISIIV